MVEVLQARADLVCATAVQQGRCPWCHAREYPVDREGTRLTANPWGELPSTLAAYWMDHTPDCPVSVLRGAYSTGGRRETVPVEDIP
jgi:hypothetical protein